MNRAVLEDEKRFFEIVQTTPDLIEARSMLDDALEAVKMEVAYANEELVGKPLEIRTLMLSALKSRIRSEIHRMEQVIQDSTWKKAIIEVLGYDAYSQCVAYIKATKQEHGR